MLSKLGIRTARGSPNRLVMLICPSTKSCKPANDELRLSQSITGLLVALRFDHHHFDGAIAHINVSVHGIGRIRRQPISFSSLPDVCFGRAGLILYLHGAALQSNDHPTWSWRCNGNGAFGTTVDLQTFTCKFSNCGIRCVDDGCSEDQTADVARRMTMIAIALRATVRFTIISFRSKR